MDSRGALTQIQERWEDSPELQALNVHTDHAERPRECGETMKLV